MSIAAKCEPHCEESIAYCTGGPKCVKANLQFFGFPPEPATPIQTALKDVGDQVEENDKLGYKPSFYKGLTDVGYHYMRLDEDFKTNALQLAAILVKLISELPKDNT